MYFSRVLRVFRRVLGPGFLASYWLTGIFLQVSVLATYWLEDCANFTPTLEENTNAAPTTLGAMQAESQSIFINEQLYSTCD